MKFEACREWEDGRPSPKLAKAPVRGCYRFIGLTTTAYPVRVLPQAGRNDFAGKPAATANPFRSFNKALSPLFVGVSQPRGSGFSRDAGGSPQRWRGKILASICSLRLAAHRG